MANKSSQNLIVFKIPLSLKVWPKMQSAAMMRDSWKKIVTRMMQWKKLRNMEIDAKKNTKNPYYWLYFFYFTLVFFALLWVKQALLDIWDKTVLLILLHTTLSNHSHNQNSETGTPLQWIDVVWMWNKQKIKKKYCIIFFSRNLTISSWVHMHR